PPPGGSTPSLTDPLRFRVVAPTFPPPSLASTPPVVTQVTRSLGGATVDITAFVTGPDADGVLTFQPDTTVGTPTSQWEAGGNQVNITIESTCTDPTATTHTLVRTLQGDAVINPLGNNVPARKFAFSLTPVHLNAGLQMFSLPYQLLAGSNPLHPANSVNFVFGGAPVILARFLTETGTYAIFNPNGARQDAE